MEFQKLYNVPTILNSPLSSSNNQQANTAWTSQRHPLTIHVTMD